MRKYFDDFIKLPIGKMAKKISEITYLYENTDVPSYHYSKILNKEILEIMAQDSTVECLLLGAILGQLQALKKESPRLFMKALIRMEKGIKIDNIDNRIYDSLENTYREYHTQKELLHQDIIECYEYQFENHANVEIALDDEMEHMS